MNFFKKALIAILSVGLLTVPSHKNVETVEAATPATLYLTPNANWKKDNARFAAYFFGNGEKWESMTDSDKDGIYEVNVPNGYPNIIFCRMNPSATANNWNNKWNQTSDLTIPTNGNNHYTVKAGTWDKGGGSWSKMVVEPSDEEKLATAKENAKKNLDTYITDYSEYSAEAKTEIENIISDAKISIDKAATEQSVQTILNEAKEKIDKVKTLEEEALRKTSTFYYYNIDGWKNVYCHAWSGDEMEPSVDWPGSLMTSVEGKTNWYSMTYTYYDSINIIFHNGEGTQTSNIEGLTSSKYFYGMNITGYDSFETVESVAKPTPKTNIYFTPNDNWRTDDARFAAYFFNDTSNIWADLVDTDNNGVFETEILEGKWTTVIFCRMNPATAENGWDNKWNQTADITLEENNNHYYLPEDVACSDKVKGTWGVYDDSKYMTHGETILLRAKNWSEYPERPVGVYVWGDSTKKWIPMELIPNSYYYKFTVPSDGAYHSMIFGEHNENTIIADLKDDFSTVYNGYNRTYDITYNSSYNVVELKDDFWGTTEAEWNETKYTTRNTKIGTGYYVPTDVKAELGFTYSYNDSTGEITGVENMKMRLSSDYISLDSFVNINVNDITGYGMRIAKGNDISVGTKIQTWTNSQIGKFTYNEETKEYNEIKGEANPTHIRWALTIENIPSEYYTGEFTYECFVVINEVEYTISNTRTVSVTNLAKTYAGMEGIREDHKEACQYIVDTYAVAA